MKIGCLVAALVCFCAIPAGATYRADFFDTSKRPSVTFDKGKMTWTLRNTGVERIVHYDVRNGALQTVAFRDQHSHHVLLAAPGGEGEITFASPLLQTPALLKEGKVTPNEPGNAWTQAEFDDKTWQPVTTMPPDSAPGSRATPDRDPDTSRWYRLRLSAGSQKAGHAYALYLPGGIAGTAEVYLDGNLAQKYPTLLSRKGRPEQIDLPVNCHVIAIKCSGASPLPAYISEVGTSPPSLQLTNGWQYMHHTVNAGEDNSQILTIHLSGTKQNEGFELDVCYQIYAGDEPTIAKWFTFVSHRKSRFLMETVTYDRWLLPDTASKELSGAEEKRGTREARQEEETFVLSAMGGDVLMTGVLAHPAVPLLARDQKSAAPNAELDAALRPELPYQTPRSITAFWHGTQGTGQFLHQLYLGQYVVSGNPTAIPIAYDTRFAYPDLLDAATCEKIVPLAAAMGAQAFVLDDGWQSNFTPDTGRYGDWDTDKHKFPRGILPISLLIRENKMRFGLWIDAVRVDVLSQAAAQHPDWLYKPLPVGGADDTEVSDRMCFTGAWARQFTQSIVALSREQGLTYLKTRFHFSDGCMATGHEHPVGHSAGEEEAAWSGFREAMQAISPTFVQVDDVLAENYWRGKRFLSPQMKHVRGWLEATDLPPIDRTRVAEERAYLTPSYVFDGEAFCHLPTEDRPTREQSEFLWSRTAATYPSFEVQGDLQQMTSEEREIAHKWIDWNTQNREWLAFAQPLTLTAPQKRTSTGEQGSDGGVRGMLHLRNVLRGRYGYACLWNPNDTERTVTPTFDPADYFVRLNPGSLQVVDINSGRPAAFTAHNGAISLGPVTLPAYGWAIYELKTK